MDTNKTGANPILVLALAVLAISFSALMVRLVTAPPAITALWRLILTCLMLAPFTSFKEIRGARPKDLVLIVLGGVFLALHFTFWFASLSLTTISSSTLLVNIHPLAVVSLGWLLFGEKIHSRALPGALLGLAGIALLGWGDLKLSGPALRGDLWAAAGGLMLAGYYLVGRSVRQRLSMAAYSLLVYGASATLLLAYNLLSGTPLTAYPPRDWLLFGALALVPTIGGHTLLNWALGHLPAAAVSVSVLAEPVLATILAALLLAEYPGPIQLLGGLAVILGIWVFLRSH